ncbi:peptidase [Kitasatospora sp. MMS16-BH015]|uniref:serine hydrolase domain-containing protein n=1 Tax=Kitasatospora sp. MMS16-BH015 TaxID=2018025 RepID=UPI000CA1D1F4|nr:serine hydrolase domain-containing protein [Kitasatospora sp. MMS16-BH015]AUG80578.1 peptidase [Kitasatospora sp. MMS16-BH015]
MNTRARAAHPVDGPRRTGRPRRATPAVAGTLLAALAVSTATPALAAPAAPVTVSASVGAGAAAPLPPLDPAAIRQAVAGLPDANVNGVLVRITGSAGSFATSAGVGDRESGERPDVDGRFRIGSISKVFTATVLLQLAAEHRVDLDATVQQYLPGLLPAEYPPIKVGQLLNHTSGLPGGRNTTGDDGSTGWFAAHRYDSLTPEQVVAAMKGEPMSFAPGTAQQYNGQNTYVAGLLIERLTGHSYAHEVERRIVKPLHLRDTTVPAADDPRLNRPAAHGYLAVPGPDGGSRLVDVTEQSPWPWAEGGLISSAPDLDRFMTALLGGRLLPPAEQQALFTVPDVPNHSSSHCNTPADAGRACMSTGLERVEINGVTLWGKTGSRPGYVSGVFATRDLARKMVYSFNPTGLQGAEGRYIQRLAAAVLPAPEQAPAAKPAPAPALKPVAAD